MQGQLFTQDFLRRGVQGTDPWVKLDDADLDRFIAALRQAFVGVTAESLLNEAQTEQEIIVPLLHQLGWAGEWLPQVNLSDKGREDVPDFLLFHDAHAKARALAEPRDTRRYRHGLAILEAKRWQRALDRGDPREPQDPDAPSSQMLRYLSRVDVMSDREVKWGVLTNGALWRLYWQDARSRVEQYLELDVAAALGLPGTQRDIDDPEPRHALKLFFLFFNRAAFLRQSWDADGRSFHAYARHEARLYEEAVSRDLGERVFSEVFPRLAEALARGDLQARTREVGYGSYTRRQYTDDYLAEVREAALVLLYRLLFLFYAEDRLLLPARDARYAPYSVRALRERVRDDMEAGRQWSSTIDRIWRDLQGAFQLIDVGDDEVGMPAYNGGLFDRARSPLLVRTRVPDKVMAPIIDGLSRRTEDLLKAWINYRDLSVQHLGGIYERLLEYSLVHEVQAAEDYHDRPEIDRISARPASFARKASGSYYTHDDLVRLILRESVGRLCDERIAGFHKSIADWKKRASLTPQLWDKLDGTQERAQRDAIDPATRMLELAVCDPAMGSGHFLVSLVDYLADRVLEAASQARELVNAQPWAAHMVQQGRPWESPVVHRIAHLRATLQRGAAEHGWAVTEAQLDDKHLVRRMILKKVIYGVDKNPMAVELAKTALWLHTFTVGAPLSFLDHHLKLGDSLHGERLPEVRHQLAALGMLFNQGELQRLADAARGLAAVADLTDVDLAEVRQSKRLAQEADARTAPLHALLDFWRALRWLLPGWPAPDARRLGKLGDEAMRAALAELLSPGRNLVELLAAGVVDGKGAAVQAANELLERVRALARREDFFHWWTAFPTVFDADGQGGFDVVLGNPPWDMLQMQEVEWFAERVPEIALQAKAADRKRLIEELPKARPDIWRDFVAASERADQEQRVVRECGHFPLLAEGRSNLYKLFVERAGALVKPDGLVALLTPSGIAADKGAAAFFKSISSGGRLACLFDFENKKVFFPDVDSRFKFCVLIHGGTGRRFDASRMAFFLHATSQLDQRERVLTLSASEFQRVNPNTGAAPIFRSATDARITLAMYERSDVLVRHAQPADQKAWPVKYVQGAFNMTSDSKLFKGRAELERMGCKPAALGRWLVDDKVFVPLYVGRMIHQFDHRHASVTVNDENLHNAAFGAEIDSAAKGDPHAFPTPQYWVSADSVPEPIRFGWALGFRDIARATDMRTMIAAILPGTSTGNKLPLLLPESGDMAAFAKAACCLLANLNCVAFDFATRQKVHSTSLNWFVVEQLPVIAPARFDEPLPTAFAERMRASGLMNGHHPQPTVADFVLPQVLALSYTAHDLAPFARDLGYMDAQGQLLPPVRWDDEDRRRRRAALDALFFHLYGLGEDDAAYVLDTFPIVREQDHKTFGRYRSKDDILTLLPLLSPLSR